jgi:hypothetical protein
MGAQALRRAVFRLPPELRAEIAAVALRLRVETGVEHSAAAVVRGVLVLGLASLVGRESLAPAFIGARLKRGRPRSDHGPALDVALDLGAVDTGEGDGR